MRNKIVFALLMSAFMMVGCNKNQGGNGNKPSSPQGSEPARSSPSSESSPEGSIPSPWPQEVGEGDFYSFLLADPDVRVVYTSSAAIDPAIVDYYLRFVPDPGEARRRLRTKRLPCRAGTDRRR